jgi:hypothetical protein
LVIAGVVGVSAAVLPLLGVHRWWWAPASAGVVAVLAVVGVEVRTWLDVERRGLLRRREDEVDRSSETARVLSAHYGLRRRLPTVAECDPQWLGVHVSIHAGVAGSTSDGVETAGSSGPDLPTYVPRDADAQLRTALRAAAARGGMVLLVGRSSVGKTRSAYEAVRDVMGDWSLWQPDDADSVNRVAAGPQPLHRMVIWLDEMAGAEAVLKLRALVSNGDFDNYWPWHVKQEYQRVHCSRYQDQYALAA